MEESRFHSLTGKDVYLLPQASGTQLAPYSVRDKATGARRETLCLQGVRWGASTFLVKAVTLEDKYI